MRSLHHVSRREIHDWLLHVAHIDPESPRAAYYVKNWNVVEKIRRHKLIHGSFSPGRAAGRPHSVSRALLACRRTHL
jgi:hypothetical protein